MRRVAAALDTGPASLYAHVVNKADLDELLIGRLCSRIVLPEPDRRRGASRSSTSARRSATSTCATPASPRRPSASSPSNPEALRLSEGMLAILLAGGVTRRPRPGRSTRCLYVNAYCLEVGLWVRQMALRRRLGRHPRRPDGPVRGVVRGRFPHTKRYAAELTAGKGHDRFDFAIGR